MAEFSFVSALGLAFILLLRLGGWTGVDQLPESLQAWFQVDPLFLDSLLKIWSESSTADPLLLEVLQIVLQQDRWPVCFQALHDNYLLLATVWHTYYEDILTRRAVSAGITAALLIFSRRFFTYLENLESLMFFTDSTAGLATRSMASADLPEISPNTDPCPGLDVYISFGFLRKPPASSEKHLPPAAIIL